MQITFSRNYLMEKAKIGTMKINFKKHLEKSQEPAWHSPALLFNCKPNRKLQAHVILATSSLHSRRRRFFSPPTTTQLTTDSPSSAHENPLLYELPVYSNGPFVYNSPHNFLLSSTKKCSAPLFWGLVYGFPVAGLTHIADLCYSQNKPFFLVK